MRLESSIERAAVKRCADVLGIPLIKCSPVQSDGWPDRQALIPGLSTHLEGGLIQPGRSLFIEFKRSGEVPTRLQNYRARQLRLLGYACVWVTSADAAVDACRRYKTQTLISFLATKPENEWYEEDWYYGC